MAAITKNRNFFKWPKLLYFKLVEIGSVVLEENISFKFHHPFFLICIFGQNRQGNIIVVCQIPAFFDWYVIER
jgi:hypothetical protein